MEQIENFLAPDAATDEPAVLPSTRDEHREPRLYWAGVAEGMRRCGGIVPPDVLEQAGLGSDYNAPTGDGRDPLAFDPVAVRERIDGWTPAKQRRFVEELADCGVVRRAAAAVGMTEQSVNRLRRRADARAFDIACEAAQRIGARRLHSIAWERAVEGTLKRHYYHGELKSEERVWNDRLLIYLLGRTRRFDQPSPESERVLADWEGWMDAIEQGGPVPGEAAPSAPDEGEKAFDGSEVWEDSEGWWTDFPPPEDFDDVEYGRYGDLDYRRRLTGAEQAVIDADEAEGMLSAHARRDLYFGFDRREDSSSLQAELSEPSAEIPAETPRRAEGG